MSFCSCLMMIKLPEFYFSKQAFTCVRHYETALLGVEKREDGVLAIVVKC
jgi:hypothetical protein